MKNGIAVNTDVDFTSFFTPKAAGTPGVDEKFQAFSIKSIDTEKRQITGVASAEIIDRDDEIVTIAALRKAIKEYMKNPVILAGHAHRTDSGKSPVIGKVVSYHFKGKQLYITVEFADTELGMEYWKLYRDKFQRAFSIGFRVLKHHEDHRDGKRVGVIDEIDLYEISCVAVPANPAALSKSKSFVQQKKIEREKTKILNDDEVFCKLLDRYDKLTVEYDPILDNSELWGRFSAAEKQILLELEQAGKDFADGIDEVSFCDDFGDDFEDSSEDYAKAITGDFDAFDDFEMSGDDEPDYFS